MLKVSVIIPSYNSATFLSHTIDSVLQQTYKHIEIIIVDDGSKDNTKEILKPYLKLYTDKIKYFYQKNAGSSVARNNGIKLSNGDYVAFLDADDQWFHDKLERQLGFVKNNSKYQLVFSNARIINQDGYFLGNYIKDCSIFRDANQISLMLLMKNFIPFSSVMAKRDILNKVGLFDESLKGCEDYDLLLKITRLYPIGFISDNLINYRISPGNKSSNIEFRHRMTLTVVKRFSIHDKKFLKKHRVIIYKRWADCHYSLGYALYEKNKLRDASKEFSKSIAYCPFLNFKQYLLLAITLLAPQAVNHLRHFRKMFYVTN